MCLFFLSTDSSTKLCSDSSRHAWKQLQSLNPNWLNVKRATGSELICRLWHAPGQGQQFPQFPLNQREALVNCAYITDGSLRCRTKMPNWQEDGNEFTVSTNAQNKDTHTAGITLTGSSGHTQVIAAINFDNRMSAECLSVCLHLCVCVRVNIFHNCLMQDRHKSLVSIIKYCNLRSRHVLWSLSSWIYNT